MIHPAVAEFTDTVLHATEAGEVLAQVDPQPGSQLDGATVGQAFEGRDQVQILGIRHRDGRLDVAPTQAVPHHAGDVVMVFGSSEGIESFSAAAASPASTD